MSEARLGHDLLGLGVGLRTVHFNYILEHWPEVDWFEVVSENFMDSAGRPRHVLDQIAERYPTVMHGVSLSIGSTDPLDFDYLGKLKRLAREIKPRWISDHLCWTGVLGLNAHDLLPIPLNEETLRHVTKRVRTVQDFLERPLVLENPSTYVTFAQSTMSEWEFLSRLADEADCGLLLDVNNVYVSSVNHDFDPREYLENVPHGRIVQCHLAGHANCRTHLIDTHDDHVIDPVWELYRLAHARHRRYFDTAGMGRKNPRVSGAARRGAQGAAVHGCARSAAGAARGSGALGGGANRDAATNGVGRVQSDRVHRVRDRMKPKPAHLDQIQRWMQSVIMHPGGVAEGVEAAAARQHLDVPLAELDSVIQPSQALSSSARLEIYVDAYYERLLECLRQEFCGTQYAVGEELFDALAFGYLQSYPSGSYTLGQLGASLAQFLEERRLHAQDVPEGAPDTWPEFVVELAQFERVQREVFDAEGTERGNLLDFNELASVAPGNWPGLQLTLAPCLRLFRATHPVHAYWQAFREESAPAAPESRETWVAINRRNYLIERHGLSAAQYALLSSLAAGEPLGRAIGAAAAVDRGPDGSLAEQLGNWFAFWSRHGFFIAMSQGESSD